MSSRDRGRSTQHAPSHSSNSRASCSPPRQHRASSDWNSLASQRESSSSRRASSPLPRSSSPLPRSSSPVHSSDALRRKCEALEETLGRLQGELDNKKNKKLKSDDSLTKPGRGINKVVDLYHELDQIFAKSDKHAAIDALEPEELEEIDRVDFIGYTAEQIEDERKELSRVYTRKRCHTAVLLLHNLIPGLQDEIASLPAAKLKTFLAPLRSGAQDGRSDDTCKLKAAVAQWLNVRRSSPEDPGPCLDWKDKDGRGVSNDFTGRLLCPIDYDWEDLGVRAKLRDASPEYDMASSYFIRCLYEDEKGDSTSPLTGFLKGPLLVRAYRHVFTSPSSASKGNLTKTKTRRRDVATITKLNGHVTPRSIAYVATQLLFSLNTAPEWCEEHAGFHYPSFYNFVVDFFEDADDDSQEDVKELLQWWNSKVFPPVKATAGGSQPRKVTQASKKRLQDARALRAINRPLPTPQSAPSPGGMNHQAGPPSHTL